jgi:hypothetical protein
MKAFLHFTDNGSTIFSIYLMAEFIFFLGKQPPDSEMYRYLFVVGVAYPV